MDPELTPGVPLPRMGDHLIIEQVVMHRTTRQIFIIVRLYDRSRRFAPPTRLVVEYVHWLMWESVIE
jgi:hypothetical protein